MRAGLKLSEQRGEAVKQAILAYASRKSVRIEAEQIIPVGVGIKEPVIAKPTKGPIVHKILVISSCSCPL
jgi:outer membrane protein OmpA-like peptidoglycan-associated protein